MLIDLQISLKGVEILSFVEMIYLVSQIYILHPFVPMEYIW